MAHVPAIHLESRTLRLTDITAISGPANGLNNVLIGNLAASTFVGTAGSAAATAVHARSGVMRSHTEIMTDEARSRAKEDPTLRNHSAARLTTCGGVSAGERRLVKRPSRTARLPPAIRPTATTTIPIA